jgi:signal transduction histidine kinase
MAKLIDQLLMLARYESSRMNPHIETVALSPHIDRLIERMLPSATTKDIAITSDQTENIWISADPGMLDMILDNILSNAIKYSPNNSTITVTVKRKANTIVCSISNQGAGIPEEKLNAIFERFYRVDESRNAGTGGFGLGLSIVKKLADLQHIEVTVTSETRRGTTFTLTCQAGEANR